MLFGDSITQGGWERNGIAARLAHLYARRFDVINRGYSGYNTEWAIPVFEQVFAKQDEQHCVPKVCLLTIWFGANDSTLPSTPQHVPLAKFKANLKHLISAVRSPRSARYSPSTRILLISPPPVNTYQRGADLLSRDPPRELDREFDTTKTYAEAVLEVGEEEGLPVVDCWSTLWEAAGRDERSLSAFLYDGLHLNEAGYEVAYNELIRTIEENYPELCYDTLREVIPRHDELDCDNLWESAKLRSVERPRN